MNEKVYVVTADGWFTSYGSLIFLVGVFTDKAEAEKAAANEKHANIKEIPINKTFPLKGDTWEAENDYFLGGFCE